MDLKPFHPKMPKQQYPEPTCGALIFNQKNQIFLMKSHKWRGKYVIPGGHVELGETIKDALKREIKEETGLNIFDIEFICYQDFIFDNAFWKKKHFIFFDFACKTKSTKVKLNSEAQEYIWVSIKEALRLPAESYTKNAIKKYLKNLKVKKPIQPIANLDALNDFLKSQPHSELLQSPLWAKVQEADGRRVFYFGLIDEANGSEPADSAGSVPFQSACLIIKHNLPLGKSWLYSPRLNWPAELMPQLIDEVAKIAKKENAIFWKAENLSKPPVSCFMFHVSCSLQPPETFIINLTQSEDQLLKNMKPKTRYNIKLAQKKGVKTRWSTDTADINIFYDLLTATARRQKIKIHSKNHYQNILKILSDQDAAALAIAEIGSSRKPLAANLITFFGDTAAYLHGGSSDNCHELMAPYLLQWEAILEAKRRGSQFYDMGGCAVKTGKIDPWAGITRFKSGFNGELKQFGLTCDIVFNRRLYRALSIARKLL